jgi:hypothetical protein
MAALRTDLLDVRLTADGEAVVECGGLTTS